VREGGREGGSEGGLCPLQVVLYIHGVMDNDDDGGDGL
jgi:hypothetical protein